jgi:hypothetical protein
LQEVNVEILGGWSAIRQCSVSVVSVVSVVSNYLGTLAEATQKWQFDNFFWCSN